ncbi:hypothetical protein A5724_07565 [Mycobacterium sp. ACS1612]|uniref:DUF4262 domain-containing protein n=1 Tax=Mycobacterium sp. ACS1612 TaxID=1834117 RepID=UPI000800016D|nr:DUF4262 domain-containing protein [Mycobacterium sp. ACS1612]OBF40623.1 hypothetical protein A5724_07565 [Mycobacterium sp. ACS1612]
MCSDYYDLLQGKIRKAGWTVQYVESDRPPYAYTIGLHDWDVPELLITGVSRQRGLRLLDAVARKLVSGEVLTPGQQVSLPDGPLVEVVEVGHPDVHMGWAVAFGGPDIEALQLVWADGRGRWPWSAQFVDGRATQPVLGCRTLGASWP